VEIELSFDFLNFSNVDGLNAYMNPAKQKLSKEIMALTFAKGRDLCGLFSQFVFLLFVILF